MTKTYYVHRNSGNAVFVKEADFFWSQGGTVAFWGKAWTPVSADSIEHARQIGENILPRIEYGS